jgi:hypothetical protein
MTFAGLYGEVAGGATTLISAENDPHGGAELVAERFRRRVRQATNLAIFNRMAAPDGPGGSAPDQDARVQPVFDRFSCECNELRDRANKLRATMP